MPINAQAILDFWFLPANHGQSGQYRQEWFGGDDAFVAALSENFAVLVDAARVGGLADWETTTDGVLALILLLDSLPRHLFRGMARSFAGDARALALATQLVATGRDKNLPPIRRWFAFMPFTHSEAMINQERSLALFAGLRREAQHEVFDAAYAAALQHHAIIECFGRFPQRNALLGRESTVMELEALQSSAWSLPVG